MQYWLTAGTYNDLYNSLYDENPALADQFAGFFEPNQAGTYYQVKNYDGYMNWLQTLFGDDPIGDDFIAWSDYQFGVSNQNTGGL